MKLFFIVNPVAGKGNAQDYLPIIKDICSANNVEYEIAVTSKKGDATLLGQGAVANGYKKVIAVGGDGTVNEVLNGIAGSGTALGVIPAGSGNDFMRSIAKDMEIHMAISNVIHGSIKKVDLGKCNGKYFINVASVGIDAEVAKKAEMTKKLFSGSLAYLTAAISTIIFYKGWSFDIKIDNQPIQGKTLLIAIANGKYYGGGVMPAPNAKIDDGYFDICHVSHIPKLKIFSLLPKYMKGKHSNIKEVSFYRGKRITISSNSPFAINLDGEITMNHEAEFQLIEKGIPIIFPPEKP